MAHQSEHITVGPDGTPKPYVLPAGTRVYLNAPAVHYHPKYWPDPYKLDPGRWCNSPGGEKHDPCLGRKFAQAEYIAFFITLLRQYCVSLAPGSDPAVVERDLIGKSAGTITLAPLGNISGYPEPLSEAWVWRGQGLYKPVNTCDNLSKYLSPYVNLSSRDVGPAGLSSSSSSLQHVGNMTVMPRFPQHFDQLRNNSIPDYRATAVQPPDLLADRSQCRVCMEDMMQHYGIHAVIIMSAMDLRRYMSTRLVNHVVTFVFHVSNLSYNQPSRTVYINQILAFHFNNS
ncbi:hypothetical protein ETB97_000450 [Aspergillus alliaceus]|uniref:Uncharacterized protein n=1 Tax=Petromyces alliaceus TaxID=209559 RepID=A0A8H6E7D5_PETAA|nr:hypothetical protein ETB97_000450 [Aspergillus burnettii]